MFLYHSTSLKKANQIKKSGQINAYCYFSDNYKTSRYYGSMVSGKVVTFKVEYNENDFIKGSYYQNTKPIQNFETVKL